MTFLGESEGSLPQPQDSFRDASEAMNDFWSMSGNFMYRHHVEPRVKLYSSKEESFHIPLKYIDVSRTTHTNLDVKQGRRIDDYWNIDGSRDLSDYWTGFTQFTPVDKKPPAMPCKISKNNLILATGGKSNEIKSKLACILEAGESTRLRMGESLPNHEDHIAGKGYNSLQHYNLVHKFIPMPQAMKIPAGLGKIGEISAWNLTKVKSKKQVINEASTSGATVHFASSMDICHLKNTELEAKHQKYKGRVVLRGDIVKDDSGSYAVFTEQGSSAFQLTAAKVKDIISRLPGCAGQAADAVSAETKVKIEDAPQLLKIPKPECPDHLDSSTTTQMAKIMVQYGRPRRSSERNLFGHPLAGLLWEKQFEKILLKHGWEKIPNWECLFVHSEKGFFLSVYVDDIKIG